MLPVLWVPRSSDTKDASISRMIFAKIWKTGMCSHSMASGTGLYDLARHDWDDRLLETVGADHAQKVLDKLRGEYDRAYYAGVIFERWAKAQLRGGAYPGNASGFFQLAMDWYGKAMALSPQGNDDAILRWNACVRFMQQNPHLKSEVEESESEAGFPDGAPAR